MEQIAAILLLLGCNDAASACERMPATNVAFESMEQCEEYAGSVLVTASDDFPVVITKCIDVDLSDDSTTEIRWHMNGRGELITAVRVVPDVPSGATVVSFLAGG